MSKKNQIKTDLVRPNPNANNDDDKTTTTNATPKDQILINIYQDSSEIKSSLSRQQTMSVLIQLVKKHHEDVINEI